MAEPINIIPVNPNITPQPGMGEESIAASAEMIVTGVERKLNIRKTEQIIKDPRVSLKELDQYIQKLTETTKVDHIMKREERKGEENEDLAERQPKKRNRKRKSKKPIAAFDWLRKKNLSPKNITLKAGEIDGFRGKIDPQALKEYIISYIKATLGIPREEQEEIAASLEIFKKKFRELNIREEFIKRVQTELNKTITTELSRAVKSSVLKNLSSNDNFIEWIIANKRSESILNYALYNEYILELDKTSAMDFIGKALKEILSRNWNMKFKEPKELVEIGEELGIDLNSWLASFADERISISKEGTVTINSSLLKSEWQRAALLDEYKMLHITLALEEDIVRKICAWIRLKKVEEGLEVLNTKKPELNTALTQAKKIAWAKIIARLKEAHLVRVFSTSQKEFNNFSSKITRLTKKARKIGLGISKEGLKLVEAKLIQLAAETATYKLELLKSMQNLEYDEGREKDMRWLNITIARLKATEEGIEILKKLFNLLSKFFGTKEATSAP